MKQNRFTPGPWLANFSKALQDKETWYKITNGQQDNEETQANARLIAAAPELLEALQYAVQDLEDLLRQTGVNRNGVSLKAFKNTIAKATGGAE